MSHTPEPWRVSGTGHICAGDKVIPYDDLKADARRIVACVNACAGIKTEALEGSDLIWISESKYKSVLRQRDELLAALNQLQYAYRQIAGLHDPNTDDAFTVIAHNAIAKAKGA